MLTKSELLCNLIEKNMVSAEQIRKMISDNNFDYFETKKIFEHILRYSEFKELIECFSDDFYKRYFELLSEQTRLNFFYIRLLTSPKLLEMLEDIIINSNNPRHIYELALYVKNVNLKKLETSLINIGNSEYIYNFAYSIPNADIEKLETALINTKNVKYVYYFARDIEKANIEKLEDFIIEYGHPNDIYEFALDVSRAHKQKLEDAIIRQKNARYIYEFARHIPYTNIQKLETALINIGDPEYIYNFAFHIKNVNIEKLEQAIINSKNSEYIYYFAKCIKGANIKKLENAILNTDDIVNILNFSKYVKYSNSQKLRDRVAELVEKKQKDKKELEDLIQRYIIIYQKYLQNNRSVKIIEFVKDYFNLELDIKEARKLIEENLIEIINNIGLVSLYYQVSNPDFPIKKMVFRKLMESYPENQDILQVYYNFLIDYTNDFSELISLDKQYLELKQKTKI